MGAKLSRRRLEREDCMPPIIRVRQAVRAAFAASLHNVEMPTLIAHPTRIAPAGNKPKVIDEYVGRVNTGTDSASVAHMRSPSGWLEPGQRPQFDEFTVVLKGTLRVEFEGGAFDVDAGQAVIVEKGEWVRYSTPAEEGAEYIAVCLPAFSPSTVNRDDG